MYAIRCRLPFYISRRESKITRGKCEMVWCQNILLGLKFSPVIPVRLEVWRHHHSVGELSSGQRVLSLLAVRDAAIKDKQLLKNLLEWPKITQLRFCPTFLLQSPKHSGLGMLTLPPSPTCCKNCSIIDYGLGHSQCPIFFRALLFSAKNCNFAINVDTE